MISVGSKKWSKTITGNSNFSQTKAQIRGYIERDINSIDLTPFPKRPEQKLNFSLGDPTTSKQFRTDQSNLLIAASLATRQESDLVGNFHEFQESRITLSEKYRTKTYTTTKEDVYIIGGSTGGLYGVAKLLCDPGDNFLFPSPSFPYLLTLAQIYGFEPKLYNLNAEQNWQGVIEEMESLIDEKTKFIVINDPSNPLGSCWSNVYKKKILELCRKYNLPLLADQIYEGTSCEEGLLSFAQLSEFQDVTIFKSSGLSKRYSVPGWRVGWIIVYAKSEIKRTYKKYLKNVLQTFPKINEVAQRSIAAIISNPINEISLRRKVGLIQENLTTINSTLRQLLDHFQETRSSGTIYTSISVKVDSFNNKIANVYDFCKQLYAEENILILPGTLFGSKTQFVRMLTSSDNKKIVLFCQRLKNFCRRYRQ